MQRFFVDFKKTGEQVVVKDPRVVHQLARVLRAKIDEQIMLLDNSGREYVVELKEIGKRGFSGKLISDQLIPDQLTVLTVYLTMIKKERFEWALEKLTELGVRRVVPIVTERTVVKKKEISERWQTIIRESAEQCERARLMELGEIVDFVDAVKMARGKVKYIGTERAVCGGEEVPPLRLRGGKGALRDQSQAHNSPQPSLTLREGESVVGFEMIDLFIGPEGGWTESEQKLASGHGILPVHLPNTVLRTETAAVALATLLMYHEACNM